MNFSLSDTTSYLKHKQLTLLAIGICTLIFWSTWVSLFDLWQNQDTSYGHGPLLVGLILWLMLCTDQKETSAAPCSGTLVSKTAMLLIGLFGFGASLLYSLSLFLNIESLTWLLLPLVFTSLFAFLQGQGLQWRHLAPIGLLYFALPIWEIIIPSLQYMAVEAVTFSLQVAGIPVFIQDILVHIPSGTFRVEGGCSGVRYLLVTFTLTCLWSLLELNQTKHRILLILTGLGLSILSNWIRIILIVFIGHSTQMQSSLVQEHETFGWIIFAITLIPVLLLARSLSTKTAVQKTQKPQTLLSNGLKYTLLACLITPVLIGHGLYALIQPKPSPQILSPFEVIEQGEDFHTPNQSIFGGWRPGFAQLEALQLASLQQDHLGRPNLHLILAHLPKHSLSKELISQMNRFSDIRTPHRFSIQPRTAPFQGFELSNTLGQRWLIKIIYRIGGTTTAPGLAGKITLLKQSILNQRSDGQLILLGQKCATTCEAAEKTLNTPFELPLLPLGEE